ncbi:MAG: hypothetical protein NC311_18410 [Muribaculaceae bacterium]|nr:hypothetical protein [Muribaculaceae bacterium]
MTGGESLTIIDMTGMMRYSGTPGRVALPGGTYIVNVDGRITKLMVR